MPGEKETALQDVVKRKAKMACSIHASARIVA
jgi:hypothetical protein